MTPLSPDFLELLPLAAYVCDAQGRILQFNRRAEEIWGRRPAVLDDDQRFCGAHRLWEPDGRPMPHAETPMARVLRTGEPVRNGEAVVERPDGTRVPVLVNIAPLRDASGALCGALNCFQDAGTLQARNQELAAVMDSVPAIVWVAQDPEARRITGSRAAAEFLRVAVDGNMSVTAPDGERPNHFRVYDLQGRELTGDDLPVQAAAKGRELRGFEEKVVFEDGSVHHLYGNAVPLRGLDGRPSGAVAAFIDVTAVRRNQEAAARLAAVVESSDDAVISKTLEGVVQTWNRGAERLFGYSAAEMIGAPITRIVPDDRLPEEERILSRIRRGERVEPFETVRRRKDGALVHVSVGVSPVRDPSGRIIAASKIARDISDLRRIQLERKAVLEREREARRTAETLNEKIRALNADLEGRVRERTRALEEALAELNAFSYSVAHDLRAPLRAMHRYGELLREDYAGRVLDEQAFEYLRRIEAQAKRMDDLIQGLLSVSRLARADVSASPVDVEHAFREATAQIEADALIREADLRFEGPPARVLGDRLLLGQILANYLSNALKFVPPDRRPCVRVATLVRDGCVRVAVEDNGPGFPEEARDRLFNLFERLGAARQVPGNGIGLAVAKKAAERMGGTVGAENRPEGGSRFWVDLPAAESACRTRPLPR